MSYDLDLYTIRAVALVAPATSTDCNIGLDANNRLDNEDISESIRTLIGAKRYLTRIHIEGAPSTEDSRTIDVWLAETLTASKGLLVDLQTDRYETTSRSGYVDGAQPEDNNTGWMNIYFSDGEDFYDHGFAAMLQDIADLMPEALPTRYGYYEPLQGKVEKGDVSDLIAAFKSETDIFMKGKSPFSHIFMSVPCKKTFERYHPRHHIRRNFLLGRVSFELRPNIFDQTLTMIRLTKLFEAICLRLDVVYAEITTADNRSSWLWYGLPKNRAHTICVGRTYQAVWPEIARAGYQIGPNHRVIATDRLGNAPPRPSRALVAPDNTQNNPGEKPTYAQVFPFNYRFDPKTYIW